MKTKFFLLFVVFVGVAATNPDCSHCLNIGEAEDRTRDSSACSVVQTVSDLQSALVMIAGLTTDPSVMFRDCVQVNIPAGSHSVTAPVDLGDASVEFVASVYSSPSVVQCNYTVDVDLERIFDPDYDYVNYTMSFSGSDYVSFDSVEFVGCSYPLRLERVRNVAVRNSTFQKFSEAVFDFFNCPNIIITDSTFFNNSGTGISSVLYRGNTGGVAIGFSNIDIENTTDPSIMILRCNFTNNRASANGTARLFYERILTGRGGGLGIFINESLYNITGVISDNVFVGNYALSFGGGLYIVVVGENTQSKFFIVRNIFERNETPRNGGGILFVLLSFGLAGAPHQINITDCSFIGNTGRQGGGAVAALVDAIAFSVLRLERCNFSCNQGIGAAISALLLREIFDEQSRFHNEIIDCIFQKNTGSDGIVAIHFVPTIFQGSNLFIKNSGTSSLRILGALMDIYGSMEFTENKADGAASLELLSFSQIRIHSDLRMNFTKNVGRFGSSISSSRPTSSRAYQNLIFNLQCFMIYEGSIVPPTQWDNVSVSFEANEAVLASSIYASTLETCSWFPDILPVFNSSYFFNWPIWNFQNNSNNSGYGDPFLRQYQVQTRPRILETPLKNISAWPGKRLNIPLKALDEYQTQTTASARFTFRHDSENVKESRLTLQPQAVLIDSDNKDFTLASSFALQYTLSSIDELPMDGPLGYVDVNTLFKVNKATGDSFTLYSDLCPGGFELVTSPPVHCRCEENAPEVLNCEDEDSIVIQNGLWASTVPSRDANAHVMSFHVCPAGYCRCVKSRSLGKSECVYMFVNSNPDAQCECNRQGILCGDCIEGFGVSALFSNCVTCSYFSGLIILLLIVIDAAVMSALLFYDTKIHPVFYTFAFYFQTIPFASLYFPETFQATGKYMYFFSSLLSFYLPYDFCLSKSLSPEVAYFFRLIPFFIAVLAVVLLVIVVRHGKWKLRLRLRGVWLVFLLLYSHTVYTSLSILNCPSVTVKGSSQRRWFVSGGTVCFTGGHAPLAVLAIVLLLLCLLLIPLVACIATGKIPKWFYLVRKLQKPLVENFSEHMKWWAVVELGRRFFSIIFIVFFPKAQVWLLLFLCVVLVLYGYLQPYKKQFANILEVIVQLNFILLLLLVSSQVLEQYHTIPSLATSSGMSDNSSACVGRDSLATAPVTWILTPFFYLPLAVSLCLTVACIIRLSTRKFRDGFGKYSTATRFADESEESDTDSNTDSDGIEIKENQSGKQRRKRTLMSQPSVNEIILSELESLSESWSSKGGTKAGASKNLSDLQQNLLGGSNVFTQPLLDNS